jgi:hypothetical protein
MSRPASLAATALSLALLAGCGTAAPAASGPGATAPPGGMPSLATPLVTAGDTWAVVVMGGSAASRNNFWQLFVRPAASTQWQLVTPPGVADNGGLVLAATGGQSLITGFRPSQYLTYTPLAVTGDTGRAWSPAGPLNGALADVPDALAAAPATGRLLALLTSGTAQLAAPGYTRWSTLTSQHALAATPPGRRCGLSRLTAAAFTPTGIPVLAGTCSHPGTTGVFAASNRTWQASGPRLPAPLARQPSTVIRLTRSANRLTALLKAGNGPAASLMAAWSADSGHRWVLSPPLPLHGAALSSTSFGPAGAAAVVLTGNRARALTGAGAAWRSLPALPPGTATLAPRPAGGFDALAVHGARLTIWRLSSGAATWHTTQVINVPIQFGSSG